jgi:hypothetical protein
LNPVVGKQSKKQMFRVQSLSHERMKGKSQYLPTERSHPWQP